MEIQLNNRYYMGIFSCRSSDIWPRKSTLWTAQNEKNRGELQVNAPVTPRDRGVQCGTAPCQGRINFTPGTAYRDKGMMNKIRAGCRSCRLVAPYVDLVGPRAHLRRVVPCLHPQQQVHAEAEGLLDPQRHFGRQ